MTKPIMLARPPHKLALPQLLTCIIAVSILILSGCSEDPATDEFTLPNGSMSATINGTAWNATLTLTGSYTNNIFAAAGSGDGITIGFATFGPEGTLLIQDGGGTNGVYSEIGLPGASWSASPGTGTGSVTITSISTTGASGTFAFEATPDANTGATGTKSITNGRFDVTF